MTSTPARRSALVSILVLFATFAGTLAVLRYDVLEQGPGPQAQIVLNAQAEKSREQVRELAGSMRATSDDLERPTGRLDHDGYQQYFDWFQPWAAATLMDGIADGSGWSTADTAAATADALDPVVAELRSVQPPADVRELHERLVDSYVGYQDLLERLADDPKLQRQPARDMTALVRDEPEVREMWAVANALEAAGYDTGDDRVAGDGATPSIEELQAETQRLLAELEATRAADAR
jgi:hypothetical protein